MNLFFKIFLILFFFATNQSLFALQVEERLTNEEQEKRAMNLFVQVRCMVCDGQVIESSNSEFSFNMRKLIREKISQGKSDDEIKKDLIADFGDDIITDSHLSKTSFALWFLTAFFIGISFFVLVRNFKKT